MAIVLLLDQIESRTGEDRVGSVSEALNARYAERLVLPFARTIGDEMQGVLRAESLGDVVREVLKDGQWWIGVGIGPVEDPLPSDTREARGPAFWNAREAIGKAKNRRRARPLAVVSTDQTGDRLEQCLSGLAYVINRRTPSQRRAAFEYETSDGNVNETAVRLGMSVQGARKNVLAAGSEEEEDLASLAGWIAGLASDLD